MAAWTQCGKRAVHRVWGKGEQLMDIKSAAFVCFSPTGTTKKVGLAIAAGMGITAPRNIDLTRPGARLEPIGSVVEDVLVIGMPVYEEHLPDIVGHALAGLAGRGQPAVLYVVYGNIGFGMALCELYSLVAAAGFTPVGAAAFIGEHSFSTAALPLASGRPDANDLELARDFGAQAHAKLTAAGSPQLLSVPGSLPLMARVLPRNSARMFTAAPQVDSDKCNHCGACANGCPAGAIDASTFAIDDDRCLRCFACVRHCRPHAREIAYRKRLLVTTVLRHQGGGRKEPAIFL